MPDRCVPAGQDLGWRHVVQVRSWVLVHEPPRRLPVWQLALHGKHKTPVGEVSLSKYPVPQRHAATDVAPAFVVLENNGQDAQEG